MARSLPASKDGQRSVLQMNSEGGHSYGRQIALDAVDKIIIMRADLIRSFHFELAIQ